MDELEDAIEFLALSEGQLDRGMKALEEVVRHASARLAACARRYFAGTDSGRIQAAEAQVTASLVRHPVPNPIPDTPEDAMRAWLRAGRGREGKRDRIKGFGQKAAKPFT